MTMLDLLVSNGHSCQYRVASVCSQHWPRKEGELSVLLPGPRLSSTLHRLSPSQWRNSTLTLPYHNQKCLHKLDCAVTHQPFSILSLPTWIALTTHLHLLDYTLPVDFCRRSSFPFYSVFSVRTMAHPPAASQHRESAWHTAGSD